MFLSPQRECFQTVQPHDWPNSFALLSTHARKINRNFPLRRISRTGAASRDRPRRPSQLSAQPLYLPTFLSQVPAPKQNAVPQTNSERTSTERLGR